MLSIQMTAWSESDKAAERSNTYLQNTVWKSQ
jgi:hypothetical protein